MHFIPRSSAVGGRGGAASGRWIPNTDVYTTDTGLVIKVELAGMKSENLEITVEGHRLRISGSRPDVCRAHKCNFLVMEISYGPFERWHTNCTPKARKFQLSKEISRA
jgi:HSP20 family protein